ncbi:MAG: RNA polymerase sigma factor [Acidimicrobiia bacterium]
MYLLAYPRLLAYAWRRVGSRQLADEAVSETMTRAIAAISRYRPMSSGPVGWLFGILRNVVREIHRRPTASSEFPDDLPGGDDPVEALMNSEERRLLLAAFAELDPNDQEILELRVVGRLTADEVAQVLGKRPGAVRMAQSRALDRLRQEAEKVGLYG